ncbi:unnamed protein product [Oncorhynchus mykiss]|uniref:Uncharacterized protein n=1 Tax=Oncorhynchus mykiss TaxID=8022 RepID=A0A060VWC7_ONCMY|nr:unnamed protein product [Oncorhynchus mykiss]
MSSEAGQAIRHFPTPVNGNQLLSIGEKGQPSSKTSILPDFTGRNRPRTLSSESLGMSYERILSIQSLSEVENPWKSITLNRCIVFAIIIVLVSSGVNEIHDALDVLLEENDLPQMFLGGTGLQPDGIAQPAASLWDSLLSWGSDDGRKGNPKRRGGILRIRNRDVSDKGLLKE